MSGCLGMQLLVVWGTNMSGNFYLRCGYAEDRSDAILLWMYGTDRVFVLMYDRPTEKQLRHIRKDLIRSHQALSTI